MVIHQKVPDILNCRMEELQHYFLESWELNDQLFSALQSESSFYLAPDPLRNPLIFYFGHTAAFYVNKLLLSGLIESGINSDYEIIFARGVDPATSDELDVLSQWPTVGEVEAYRKEVKSMVSRLINSMSSSISITEESPFWALLMAIEHDRIHFETSSVLIRQLDADLLKKPAQWRYAPSFGLPQENEWLTIQAKSVRLGRNKDATMFGWDNEFGEHIETTGDFQVSKNLITNFEYLPFVEEGYNQRMYWSVEGWEWKTEASALYPKFWVPVGKTFLYRAMFDVLEMPMDWPVEVNAFEAEAFCNWKDKEVRLLSEAEFNAVANMSARPDPTLEEWPNLNMKFGSPTPVGYCEDPHSEINDLYGNVWDWLRDDFKPLPGFQPHRYYLDFSEPYFDNDHAMLLGGSWATTGTGASKYYRLWFRRFFFQHAGFRLSKALGE